MSGRSGTLEHIFNFPQSIKNCMEMVRVGGHFVGITVANNLMGHGFYQFSPELYYRVLSAENGFQIEAMWLAETPKGAQWYRVADPQSVGYRVELTNSRSTYLIVVARRVETQRNIQSNPTAVGLYGHVGSSKSGFHFHRQSFPRTEEARLDWPAGETAASVVQGEDEGDHPRNNAPARFSFRCLS